MAIPTYDQLVSNPGAIGGGGVQLTKAPDIVGQDAITMGKGLDTVGEALNKVAVRNEYLGYLNRKADEKALIDSQVNDINLFQMGYESKMRDATGRNAIGLTEEYSRQSTEWIQANEKNIPESLRPQWKASVDAQFIKGARVISTYESEQKRLYREASYKARKDTTQDRIANESFIELNGQLMDHEQLDSDVNELKQLIAVRGAELGMPPDVIDAEIDQTVNDIYVTRLNRLLDTDASQAPAYFDRHKDHITDPEERRKLEDLVDTASDRALIDVVLDKTIEDFILEGDGPEAKSRELFREALRTQYKDPEQRAYALQQFDLRLATIDAAEEEERTRVGTDIWTRLADDPDISKIAPTLIGWIKENDPQEYKAMLKWSRDELKPAPIVSDYKVMSKLYDMMAQDPTGFSKYPLIKHSHELEKSEMNYFYKEQLKMRTDDPTVIDSIIKPVAQIKARLDAVGITTSDALEDRAYVIHEASKRVNELAERNGRDATFEEVDQVVDQLLEDVVKERRFWFDGRTQRYKLLREKEEDAADERFDALKNPPEKVEYFMQIPTDDVGQIKSAFQRKYGRQPNRQEVIDMFNAANGLN